MKLKVRIITPNGLFVDDKEYDSAYIQTTDGDMTILPMHAPIVSTLKIGTVTLADGSNKEHIHVHRGLVKIDANGIKIITERLYLVDDSGIRKETPAHL
ncbi:hypothetical protein Zmor_011830 [Zophobas morio]|uniref:ATP synthase F1 complex delta/epsilon subunit N-terminal domain-containing protein n=1 Tax=Zophobas morio TaxID=2755281 RepID=A0AA38HIU6_9CUCU|nr:hypothetical protein Zmor_011830 [Zophobas morio]